MKKIAYTLLALILTFIASHGLAADRIGHFSIKDALQRGYDEGVIDKSIGIYFKGQSHPKYATVIGTYKTNKKTNAFGKSDEKACQWVFLSAVKSLIGRAKKEGGKAVVDIVSNYKNKPYSSASQFECGAGAIMAGVALKGKVVK